MSSRSDRGEEQPPVRGVGVIRVFVADDQPIVRRGIMLVLAQEPGIEVVGEAGDGPTTIEQVQALSPHVVLMDIEMSGMSGLEATQHVVESSPDAAVLILTIHDSENYLFQALEAGAQGYILKTAGVDELLWAIKTVRAGEVFIYPRMATKLVSDYVRRGSTDPRDELHRTLSPRERQVLPMLAESHTNQEIAGILHLSPYTVQTYRQRIMKKLDLHSRTDLLKYALRAGLVKL